MDSFIENLPKCTNNISTPSCDDNKFLDINCPKMTTDELNNFCFHDSLCRVICPKDITSKKNPDTGIEYYSSSIESFKNYLDKSAKNILGTSLVEKLTGSRSRESSYFPENSEYFESSNPPTSSDPSGSVSSMCSSFGIGACYMGLGILLYMAAQNIAKEQPILRTDSSAPIYSSSS